MQIAVVEILFQDSLYDSGMFFFFPSDVISEDLIYIVSEFSFLNGLWPL